MGNCPIQVVVNASDYVEDEKKPRGGGPHKEYYAGNDAMFVRHRIRVSEQLDLFARAQQKNPYTRIAYAKVVLENKALAKSNRPTGKLITAANECKVVGGNRKGEMLVRFSPSSAQKIKAVVGKAEDQVGWGIDKFTGKNVPKPSQERSEVGAIKELLPIGEEDRCQFTAEDVAAHISEQGNGYLYVEIFETYGEFDMESQDAEEAQKMFRSFVKGLKSIPGLRAYHSSMHTAKRCYMMYMTTEKDCVVKLNEGVVNSSTAGEKVSKEAKDYEPLLKFLKVHPVVKKVTLSPIVTGVPKPSFKFDGTEIAELHEPDNLENYPLIGIADTGIADILEEWVEARIDNLNPKYKDESHGTFISGLYITGRALNANFVKERDGNRLVDICVMPDEDEIVNAYPMGPEELVENLRNSIAEAVETTGVRVIVLSMNVRGARLNDSYSQLAKELDDIAMSLDVILVISAGNLYGRSIHQEWDANDEGANIREFSSRTDDIVKAPAESIRNLTVGALNPPDNLGLACYTCKGKGLATGTKPELVHVGGLGKIQRGIGYGLYSITPEGAITTSCGTSYSAPLVAKTVAALEHQIEGDTPRETLMALAIHNANVPSAFKSKKYKPYLKDWIGFGMPADSESILFGDEHKISLVFHHAIRKGEVYRFPFSWPTSLIKNGRCCGHVKLTIVSTPELDYDYGEEFVREDVSVSLHQVDEKDRSQGTKLKPIYHISKSKSKGETVILDEEELKEGYYKWNPVKVYEMDFKKGYPVDAGPWRLEAKYQNRDDTQRSPQGVVFTIILSIEDLSGEAPVYNEMRQNLLAAGVQISDIQTAVRLTQRIG